MAGGADWDEIEETLITGDVGAALSMDLVERARKRRDVSAEEAVRAELAGLLAVRDAEHWEPVPAAEGAPAIVLVVGVNGTGKTTTIGKLAARERALGRRVVLAAADTFRAAAIDQLRIWAQRTDSEIVAHAPNADPAAVVFDALDAAVARHADILIADTAGRLHTKSNLMDELSKVRRVIDKRIPGARVETFFVLDATTGQNGLAQAKAFHEAVGLTGVVLTKLDSTAKGGIVFAIEKELGVPVRFVGVGEKAEDLLPFDPEAFVAGAVRLIPVRGPTVHDRSWRAPPHNATTEHGAASHRTRLRVRSRLAVAAMDRRRAGIDGDGVVTREVPARPTGRTEAP